jgi:hypothetical protein
VRTYNAHVAEADGDEVGDQDDDAADDERHGRADVEVIRPERQHELVRDMRALVHTQRVARNAEDG